MNSSSVKSKSQNNMSDNNITEMNVCDFFKKIQKEHKINCIRGINVEIDTEGLYGKKGMKYATLDINKPDKNNNKQPYCCERNNWTPKQINEKIKNPDWIEEKCWEGNTFSFYLKHIPDLYVIDYDTKEIDDDKLYDKLNDECVAMTETNHGYHFYLYIKNLPKFSNQQKIGIHKDIEMDLIKTNNIWETKTRTILGDIKTYEWNDIKQYFNVDDMGFENTPKKPTTKKPSPPVSPVSTDEEIDGWEKVQDVTLPKCSEEDFAKYIKLFKPRYSYGDWLKIGMICYNNFDGNNIGLKYWNEYSKDDEENYEGKKALKLKYETFGHQGDGDRKVSYKVLLKWNAIDYPPKNKYEGWFKTNTLIENMNEECMYYTPTGDILYFSNAMYIRNKTAIAKQFYKKFSFLTDEDDKKSSVNPFDLWLDDIDRKDVDKIVFNPKGNIKETEFNIWKGFKYQNTGEANMDSVDKWLSHIKNIWADGDEKTYEYILNWFSKIIQTPWKKNNICLVLHSVEGVGKSMILDMIGEIIGDDYYYSTSSLKHILGDFNGDAEAKILVNLNETNWGGDKKMVGAFKEFITDSRIVINKKGIQSYTINNYANTIITTNEEWIVSINGQDRRFNLRECKNEKYEKQYYKDISDTPLQEIANFLYNRDITEYDSRVFEKSELHELQVKKNMTSTETFWLNYLEGEINDYYGFHGDCDGDCDEDDTIHKKTHLYELYCDNVIATHEHKVNNIHFWRDIKKYCPSIHFFKASGSKKPRYKLPSYQVAKDEYDKYMGK